MRKRFRPADGLDQTMKALRKLRRGLLKGKSPLSLGLGSFFTSFIPFMFRRYASTFSVFFNGNEVDFLKCDFPVPCFCCIGKIGMTGLRLWAISPGKKSCRLFRFAGGEILGERRIQDRIFGKIRYFLTAFTFFPKSPWLQPIPTTKPTFG